MLKVSLQVRTENGGAMALAEQWQRGRTWIFAVIEERCGLQACSSGPYRRECNLAYIWPSEYTLLLL